MSRWTRRDFVRRIGSSFIAMPFVPWVLNPKAAEAQALTTRPKRVVFFFHTNGGWFHHWEPKRLSASLANGISTGDFTYNRLTLEAGMPGGESLRHHSLYPLIDTSSVMQLSTDFQRKLMPVFGMEYKGYSNHAGGTGSALVGAVGNPSTGGKSIDYWLAERINEDWQAKKPLVLGIGANETSVPTDFVSYTNSGQGNMPLSNPYTAYRSVFQGDPVSTMCQAGTANPMMSPMTPSDTPASPMADITPQNASSQSWLRRESVIDAVKEEIAYMRARLPIEHRKKLDDHLDSMNDLRKRIVPNAEFAARRAAGGRSPDGPGIVGGSTCNDGIDQITASSTGRVAPEACTYNNTVGSFPDYIDSIADQQIDLACNALGCEYTNVVTLQLFEGECQIVPSWLNTGETVHSLSHWADTAYTNTANTPLSALGLDALKMCDWYTWKFKRLLETLEARGLLDDTLVVWATDMGDSQLHFNWNVPWLMAGATNTINAGQYVCLREGEQDTSWAYNQVTARQCQSHGRVLNTIAHMFGQQATFRDDENGMDAAIISEMLKS
ncbi:MAG: DUF1552 domain-containing protein [Myxococcota bacterium]|nr:DUF1552 domain-containing protein [Myxococcota bacterium]